MGNMVRRDTDMGYTGTMGGGYSSAPISDRHKVVGIAYLSLAIAGVLVGLSIWRMTGWDWGVVVLFALLLFMPFAILVYLAAMGELVPLIGGVLGWWGNLIEGKRAIELDFEKESNRHDEAMATLLLPQHRAEMATAALPADIAPNYVTALSAEDLQARKVALEWALRLYERPSRGGGPNRKEIVADGPRAGWIIHGTPWSSRGRWPTGVSKDVGDKAESLLMNGRGAGPGLVERIEGGYRLRVEIYGTRDAVYTYCGGPG